RRGHVLAGADARAQALGGLRVHAVPDLALAGLAPALLAPAVAADGDLLVGGERRAPGAQVLGPTDLVQAVARDVHGQVPVADRLLRHAADLGVALRHHFQVHPGQDAERIAAHLVVAPPLPTWRRRGKRTPGHAPALSWSHAPGAAARAGRARADAPRRALRGGGGAELPGRERAGALLGRGVPCERPRVQHVPAPRAGPARAGGR